MKKLILKISVLALVIVGFSSCEKELEQIPFDEFGTENAYQTAADFENAIRGVYHALVNSSLYGGGDSGSMLDAPDVLADNVVTAQKGRGTKRDMHNWRYVASDGPLSSLYNAAYATSYRANTILERIDEFQGESKENIKAEAKALRALVYFNTVSFFGKIPTESGDANSSLGIAYVTETDPNMLPARETVGEVYEKIVKDLTEAEQGINASNPEGRLNKDAVNTLLSRVYLYMGRYSDAAAAANKVSVKPAERSNVVGVWEDQSRDGLLFYIPNESPVLGISVGTSWSQGAPNKLTPEYVVDYDLFQLYSDDDIRKEAFIFQGSSNEGENFNAIKKLYGRGSGDNSGVVDVKILRAAEAYLNKAEALYHTDQAAARAALDEVRSRRYTSFAGGETGDALLRAIRLERRLEFAFEYQRFFDLKRWGMAVERHGSGDHSDGSGVPADVQTLPAGNFKFELPIAQWVIDRNENIKQNPGY